MENNLNIEDLKNKISILESKKSELEYEIRNSKRNNTHNFLLALYAFICGTIVDMKTALISLTLFGFGAFIASNKNDELELKKAIEKSVLECEIDCTKEVLKLKR